jgi:methylaspartate mutase epsilon subunit
MGAFPLDKDKASDLIAMSAVIARMISADKVIVKTREEAFGIPAIATNCGAVQDVRYVFEKFPMIGALGSDAINEEADLLARQIDYVLESIFNLPGDVFWESVFQAVRLGIIDIPFAPHRMNANKLLTVRDRYNAIRIKEAGCVPIHSSDMKHEQDLLKANSDSYYSFVDKMTKDIHIMS